MTAAPVTVTILGCGASAGVPAIGNMWGKCDPENPRNRRLRVSILVEKGGHRCLVDTSPDLRQQLLAADVATLDGVFYTHEHADHLNGIDDLRTVNRHMKAVIPAYGNRRTLDVIGQRFGYVFEPLKPEAGFYKPCLEPREAVPGKSFVFAGMTVTPFVQDHGFMETLGYRFDDIAYSTDLKDLPEESFDILEGIDTWIVDCFTYDPHPTHVHLEKTLAWIERLKPRQAVLTHMTALMDYETLRRELPPGVAPAHDGMVLQSPGRNTQEKPA